MEGRFDGLAAAAELARILPHRPNLRSHAPEADIRALEWSVAGPSSRIITPLIRNLSATCIARFVELRLKVIFAPL